VTSDDPSIELRLEGHRVQLSGSTLRVGDGPPVVLGERERAVLAALIEHGGAVVSKQAIRRTVWGPGSGGLHAVEVTIARLRRRLGVASGGIETVIRRGYRLRLG